MRICVVGTGYVGLVAGACLADVGHTVACIDSDEQKIKWLLDGYVPIYEPGIEDLVRRNVKLRRLRFTSSMDCVSSAKVVFIAVGTPPGEDGSADLQHVLAAAEEIARGLKGYTVVALKSTVPVGTSDRVREVMAARTDAEFDVVSNPEFLKEGAAIDDFQAPDRIVVGSLSERARAVMSEVYGPLADSEKSILFMDPRSAELTKYAANAMLATRISFMNDIAFLCERVGADADLVREGVGADRRIGTHFLSPGVGYGGSCFPKDVDALIATGREHGVDLEILKAVEATNRRQKKLLVQRACKHYGGALAGKHFAVWGLAFKPRTDDMRQSPAFDVIEGLLGKGATVRCHDPVAEAVAARHFGQRILYADTPYDCAEGADGLFVVTDWSQFKKPDLKRLRSAMRTPVIFDGRNVFDPAATRAAGFVYYGIGRR